MWPPRRPRCDIPDSQRGLRHTPHSPGGGTEDNTYLDPTEYSMILEAICTGSDPVRRFSLTRALARKGIRAKTEISPLQLEREGICYTEDEQTHRMIKHKLDDEPTGKLVNMTEMRKIDCFGEIRLVLHVPSSAS
ncbi:MAG: hypothetical protein FRX49_02300 [Trebouxia sp. A1-2]|nr:MAG: hypothetical protein FRX49_02300 [Trebouxia sp. A1-2]